MEKKWKIVPAYQFGLSKQPNQALDDMVVVPETGDELETMAIALVYRDNDVDEINTHLIAAAPSLLAALEHAKDIFRPFTTKPIGSPNSPARRRQDAEISAYNHICAAIMTIGHKQEDDDPTPHCSWCKAKHAKDCKCGPIAEND